MSRSLPFLHAAEELSNAVAERLAPLLAAAELTAAQFNVLYLLVEEGPMRPSALAEHQRCVKSNVSYLARVMLQEGLVELSPSNTDQRAKVLSASPLGLQRYGRAKASAQKLEQSLRRALGKEALADLTEACLRTAAVLDQGRGEDS